LQFVQVCAPAKVEKVLPAMHDEHVAAPAALNEPAAQAVHTVLLVAVHAAEAKLPAEHDEHAVQAPAPADAA
jgi:hypothetical protein